MISVGFSVCSPGCSMRTTNYILFDPVHLVNPV
jgi:hypothetical protein